MSENKAKLGQTPAFAYQITLANGEKVESIGMSKRFYAACELAKGIVSGYYANPRCISINGEKPCTEVIIKTAYLYADELLKQEEL